MPAKILVDGDMGIDTFGHYKFDNGSQYMGGKARIVIGNYTVNFTGTSLSLFGIYQAEHPVLFQAIVDDGKPRNIQYDVTTSLVDVIYTSLILEDSDHTIKFVGSPNATIDYYTSEIGNNTALLGKKLIVDATDPSITYTGNWWTNTSSIITDDGAVRLPWANSTLQTNESDSSVTFLFSCTSLAIYGRNSRKGINVQMTKDGETDWYKLETSDSSNPPTHDALVDLGELTPEEHRLVIFDIHGPPEDLGVLDLDYVVYTPAFRSLAEKARNDSASETTTILVLASPTQTSISSPAQRSLSHGAIVGSVLGPRHKRTTSNTVSPIILARDEETASLDTATVVASENTQDARSRVDHLRQLMVEIQREIAQSEE
ncbi:hypothetical protein H0H87_005829 [Tephrocybe sp. NHM501043]|nr:hypothetical protein H0H87_005829 [Tephrocybe sp. NHM501043]